MLKPGSTEAAEETQNVDLNAAEGAILDKTQERLDALNDDGIDDDDGQQADETESTPESTDQADDEESTPAGKVEDAAKDEDGDKEVTLPDAYRRAAVHQGWSDDEVKEFFEATPELALKALGKIHESTNKLSADFASLGRATLRPADKVNAADSQTVGEANTVNDVDLTALETEYGKDSSVVKFAEAMQAKVIAATKVQPVAEERRQVPQQDAAITAMVDGFFTDPTLKPYVDFYGQGKDVNGLTVGQNNNRWDVLNMADNIIIGAGAQGRSITANEAMEMAHLLVSAPAQKQALRIELKAKVVKRAMGVSLKPAKTKSVEPEKGVKLSDADIEARAEDRLNKVFG